MTKNSITPGQIKQNNRSLIYHYIYNQKKVSQQDICTDLRLSRPTVTANLNALEEAGLIRKNGQIESEYVGRKAAAYSICSDARISIGVEILKREIKMIAIDLYGNKIDRMVFEMMYENSESYYKEVCTRIRSFQDVLKIEDSRVLGACFAMQGLVSPDGSRVIYGVILDCTDLSIDQLQKHLNYPCRFIHDADAAAISELWVSTETQDACYLSISTHLGAAMIRNRSILNGKHGHNGTIEHIQMDPKGRRCYCGKTGCMETLCSLEALLENESADDFFAKLQIGDALRKKRWDTYLENLAVSINLLHLIQDTDFILGGYLAPYLTEEDLSVLYDRISQLTPFPEENDFLQISRMPKHNITIGAGLTYIQNYLDTF